MFINYTRLVIIITMQLYRGRLPVKLNNGVATAILNSIMYGPRGISRQLQLVFIDALKAEGAITIMNCALIPVKQQYNLLYTRWIE